MRLQTRLIVKIHPLRAFKDNYIWIIHEGTSVWAVDPGDAGPVSDYLAQSKLDLAGILLTHHHRDHSDGISELLERYQKIPVYAAHNSPHSFVTHRLQDGDKFMCGSRKFLSLAIPGHTLDHMAFFDGEHLFCGDTLFSAGCGRVFEGTYEQMYESLEKLRALPDTTKIYCGHEYTLANLQFAKKVEPANGFIDEKILYAEKKLAAHTPTLPSLLGDEKQMNPFLRCRESSVIQAAQVHSNQRIASPVEVFTKIRQWKDQI